MDPIGISFHSTDIYGKGGTTMVFLPAATTFANAQLFATAFSDLMDAADGMLHDGITITFPGTDHAGNKIAAQGGHRFQYGANLTHNLDGVTRGYTFLLPGLKETLMVQPDGIITTDPLLVAIQDALENGIDIGGGVFIQPVNPYGLDVLSFRSGKLSQRIK